MAMITGDIKNMAKKIKKLQNAKINNHVSLVTTPKTKIINPKGKYKIALLDFGVKQNIIRSLVQRQCAVTLFPATTNAKFILNKHFHGIVLSNGPGNPKDNTTAISTIKKLYGSDIPILGICLGHQLLSLATGAVTKKLKYGHRGPNHPVKYLENQRVYITSQNHGYYIDEKTINPDIAYVTYRNINDGTVEGLKYRNKKILTVQFHPEACAGPQDTAYIFNDFLKVVKQHYAQRS
jgi:carbamoyl-phosphate synthase small subunit